MERVPHSLQGKYCKRSLWPPHGEWIVERKGRSRDTDFETAAHARCGNRNSVGEEAMEKDRGWRIHFGHRVSKTSQWVECGRRKEMILAILAILSPILHRYRRALWEERYPAGRCGHPQVPQSLTPYSHLYLHHHLRTQQISLRT